MAKQLDVADFPGEYASPDAKPDERRQLAEYLRGVDGLLIVIDPTDLEADLNQISDLQQVPNPKDRFARQQKAIESMFKDDGLDLGRSFRRTIAVVITKRDALTPVLLEWLSERGDDASKAAIAQDFRTSLGRVMILPTEV